MGHCKTLTHSIHRRTPPHPHTRHTQTHKHNDAHTHNTLHRDAKNNGGKCFTVTQKKIIFDLRVGVNYTVFVGRSMPTPPKRRTSGRVSRTPERLRESPPRDSEAKKPRVSAGMDITAGQTRVRALELSHGRTCLYVYVYKYYVFIFICI
jgi:hypothetical protein